ncbi:MAG: hypothetical protein LH481_09195, partial [Burkholderiales bacterium]|nr:hypothetical protein [Burkholderiales bacterium]
GCVQASSSPAGVKLPEVPRREGPSPKSDQFDADAREREGVLENIMDVINGYIVQFEHKRERKPSSPLQ